MKKKKRKKITNILYYISLCIIFVIIAVTLLSSNKIGIPYKIFTVESGSMKPTLKVGDLIVTKNQNSYAIGDVVTFDGGSDQGKRIIITHRIVGEEDIQNMKFYTTKGDFNSVADINKISRDSIIGVYVFKVPLIGHVISFARTVFGFIILLVIPSTLIIYEEAKKINGEWKRKKKNEIKEK